MFFNYFFSKDIESMMHKHGNDMGVPDNILNFYTMLIKTMRIFISWHNSKSGHFVSVALKVKNKVGQPNGVIMSVSSVRHFVQ